MKLPAPFSKKEEHIHVMIETPAGSRNKYVYDHDEGYFTISKILPAGTSFPLDFGFIPGTKAEDGDPLDVLVIMDVPGYPGTLLECRPVCVIEAEQKEKKKDWIRNDRIISVAIESLDYSDISCAKDINKHLLKELENFFKYYNKMEGKKFRVIGIKNRETAIHLIRDHLSD